jgi:hypothetical protein
VFHGAESDIKWLQRDFSLYVVNLFDTYLACKRLNYPFASLAYLLDKHCGVKADKVRMMRMMLMLMMMMMMMMINTTTIEVACPTRSLFLSSGARSASIVLTGLRGLCTSCVTAGLPAGGLADAAALG